MQKIFVGLQLFPNTASLFLCYGGDE